MSDDVRGLLDSREALYGRFADNAGCFVELSEVFGKYAKQNRLIMPPYQKLALIEILQKVARIANCKDESYTDNWQDIAGYAQLVVDEMRKPAENEQADDPSEQEGEPADEQEAEQEAEQVVIKTQWVGGIPDTTLIEDGKATKKRNYRVVETESGDILKLPTRLTFSTRGFAVSQSFNSSQNEPRGISVARVGDKPALIAAGKTVTTREAVKAQRIAKEAAFQSEQSEQSEPADEQEAEPAKVVIKTQWVGGIPDTTLIEDDEATKARKQRALEAKRLARAKAKAARGASGNKKSTERKRAEAKARRIAREEAFKLLPPEVQKKRLADREYYKRKLAERQARLEAASKY